MSEMKPATDSPGMASDEARGFFSPTAKRRWQNFKANRRGYWSFWIFLVIFGLSLCAELVANDRPILAFLQG